MDAEDAIESCVWDRMGREVERAILESSLYVCGVGDVQMGDG